MNETTKIDTSLDNFAMLNENARLIAAAPELRHASTTSARGNKIHPTRNANNTMIQQNLFIIKCTRPDGKVLFLDYWNDLSEDFRYVRLFFSKEEAELTIELENKKHYTIEPIISRFYHTGRRN